MPTHNRRDFVPRAVQYFLRQSYPNRELIVVDDGSDCVEDLMPADARVRYVRLGERVSVGVKRNLACEQARGSIIAHWDDDDWYAPHRLQYQVDILLNSGLDACGTSNILFLDVRTHRAWQYVYPPDQRLWLAGGTLCYTRAFWQLHRFRPIDVGEDAYFVWDAAPARMRALSDSSFYIGMIHDHNVSPKEVSGPYWQPYPVDEIQRLLGADWPAHRPGHPLEPPAPAGAVCKDVPMLTVARACDLALPEYAAFNYEQHLPYLRQWELPFVLFQSRLSGTMAVLDCTINSSGLRERLARLHPHAHYHHANPMLEGRFGLPVDVPDAAFDRVICVNTLEHLARPQREALVASMARKLKPSGWLVLTSEVSNDGNGITLGEWVRLCQPHGLQPLAELPAEPREDDPTLLRTVQPFAHACIGGVFARARATQPAGAKAVLALLSWNTRTVTVESARALLREARMLRRLGEQPIVCFCDNGSTDGTAEALRSMEPEIDVPHALILNRQNRGNSVARNQIVDYVRACDADYVLFTDGDIEVVPFSAFAMLRYMENHGREVGCIGADSAGCTSLREACSPYLYSIEESVVEATNVLAWTQYGLFRRAVFEEGVRFDEGGPFSGPGWGFEDNDLAFQMNLKNFLNRRFFGMTYLHRDIRSSIRIMRQQGIDAAKLYEQRKRYVVDKWAPMPQINTGPLDYVRLLNLVV